MAVGSITTTIAQKVAMIKTKISKTLVQAQQNNL
jgi:hypothetical protein